MRKVKIIFNILHLTVILSNGYYIIPYEMFESVRRFHTAHIWCVIYSRCAHDDTQSPILVSFSLIAGLARIFHAVKRARVQKSIFSHLRISFVLREGD